MASSVTPLKSAFLITKKSTPFSNCNSNSNCNPLVGPSSVIRVGQPGFNRKKGLTVTAAVGDLSSDSTTYLIAGAVTVALLGTAFPILFSRKDTCPECDGAGFVRKSGVQLRANAARKDQAQIVCQNCNGLGKLNQVDK